MLCRERVRAVETAEDAQQHSLVLFVDFHQYKADDASDHLLLALCRRELVPCHELCRDVVRNSEVLAPRLAADRMHGLAHIVVDFGRCGAAESF